MLSALPDLRPVLLRFPVPVLVAVAATAVFLALSYDLFEIAWTEPLLAGFTASFFLATAATLWAETRLTAPSRSLVAAAIAAAVLALAIFYPVTQVSTPLLLCASGLAVLLAPFTRWRADAHAFWWFAARTASGAMLALLGALILWLGIMAVWTAAHLLLGDWMPLGNDGDVTTLISPIIFALLAPLAWLTHVPGRDEAPKPSLGVAGPVLISLWVGVPLLAAYALVLLLYAVRIALAGALPDGQLGTLVPGFAVIGTVVFLILQEERGKGRPLARQFCRWWFLALTVPLLLLALALWHRLGQYGLTAERGLLVLTTTWLVMITALIGPQFGRADIRLIPATLLLLCLVFLAGPTGIINLANRAQAARVSGLLADNGRLADGRLRPDAPPPLLGEARQALDSAIGYLRDNDGLELLRPLFAGMADDPFAGGAPAAGEIERRLAGTVSEPDAAPSVDAPPGIQPDAPAQNMPAVTIRIATLPTALLAGPVRVLGPFPAGDDHSGLPWTVDGITTQLRGTVIEVTDADGRSARLDIGAAIQAAAEPQKPAPEPLLGMPVRVDGLLGTERVTAVLTGGTLSVSAAGTELRGGTYFLVLTAAAAP